MNYKAVYFIGVGGAGMSSLARYLNKVGLVVKGYDKVKTRLTDFLQIEGIEINFEDEIHCIPKNVSEANTDDLLLVYTPAIPENHKQLSHLKSLGHRAVKRAELLGKITSENKSIAIAGTHGKTSTTGILAHILDGYNITRS